MDRKSDKRSRTVIHAPVVVCGDSISVHVIEVGFGGESIVVHVVAGRRQVPPSILLVAITRRVPAPIETVKSAEGGPTKGVRSVDDDSVA